MSAPKRLLLVKLSSLGDVIHNLPVATDIRRAFPEAEIDWVTEAPYAPLVSTHPAVRHVWPVRLRALKSRWFAPSAWGQFIRDRAQLSGKNYDLVIDTQGLTKSALIARAPGQSVAGYDRDSVREPFASRWYQRRYPVSRQLHAVARNRALAAAALGYQHPVSCDYGLPTEWRSSSVPLAKRFAVCLHATSRADKCWPINQWIALCNHLNSLGMHVLLPSGNDAEFAQSAGVAASLSDATPLPSRSLVDTAAMLAGAELVVGVDTGLAHLAVALKRPTIGLYISTDPALTGLYAGGGPVLNMGGGTRGQPAHISHEVVATAVNDMLRGRS